MKYEIADRMAKLRLSTIKRLNRLRFTTGKKRSNDEIINDALDFKKQYKSLVK